MAKGLRPGDVLALVGPLGAGKTTFVRALVEALGGDPRDVVSPTFILATRYGPPCRVPLVHVDAYRMAGPGEFRNLGHEIVFPEDSATVIEWADKVRDALPATTIWLGIRPEGAKRRRVTLWDPESRIRYPYGIGVSLTRPPPRPCRLDDDDFDDNAWIAFLLD